MEWAGSCYFALKGATPSPLDAAALSLGSADPLSSTDPLFPLPWTPPHHSAVRAARPLPFYGPPLSTAADFSRPFRRPGGADPLSSTDPLFHCRGPLPTIQPPSARPLPFYGPPLSTAADPSPPFRRPSARPLPFYGPPLSTAADFSRPFRRPGGADPLSSTDPLFHCRGPLPTIPPSVGADSLSPAARTPSRHRRGPLSPGARTPSRHGRGPPLFHGPPIPLPWTPPYHSASVGADPLLSTGRTPLHNSVVRRRGPPLFHGTDPSPPFRRPTAWAPLSLRCRGPLPAGRPALFRVARTHSLPRTPSS
ncbi:hypothetical protein niasHT_024927 [Heterodera trifolii]|uniref:Uncharacterized protein n=1 Tax=Heterodera trifolii TaxID=157864 RepID=A0ABD2KQ14_9BILA